MRYDGESNFGDSSGRLFSMYSKAAEDEDDKMTDRWQKDAEGIIFFTGLFSAAVAALLAVTVQYLIPNSQDASAFYLGNIYQVLADPNITHTPFPIAKPRPFSPPKFAVWVNSFWFLSLVISLTCALLATSLHQWARRYIRVTRPARCSPEKRARVRAFFANGVEKAHIAWFVEGLSTLLHLSVFLFFAGLVILLFHVNLAVFNSVVWLIGTFSLVYGLITLMPLARHNSPYNSPLSLPAWFLYASISYLFLKVFFAFKSDKIFTYKKRQYWLNRRDTYRSWILGGVEKAVEKTISEQSSDIDADILHWTIDAYGDNDEMEDFFDAIPGFFESELVDNLTRKLYERSRLLERFWKTLTAFFERTFSSKSMNDYVRSRRLDIVMNAINTTTIPGASPIPKDILFKPWDQEPQNIELCHRTVERWGTSQNRHIAHFAQCIATRILAGVRERNDRWYALATGVLGLSADNLRACVAHGNDSLSLAILISVARRDIQSDFYDWGILSTLYQLNIHNALPELQHEFCMLWNECVGEARKRATESLPCGILRLTRLLYTSLHEGVPTNFSALTLDFDRMLVQPSSYDSYPPCKIPDHHVLLPTPGPAGGSRSGGVEFAPQDNTSIASILLYPLKGNRRQDLATLWVVPDIDQISFIAPTSFVVPTSATLVPNDSLASYNAGFVSTSKSPLHSSSTIPSSRSSQILPFPNGKVLSSLSTSLSSPENTTAQPRLRPRGLINEGNMCFANVALQLLVYCPRFWNQLKYMTRQIGQPKGQQAGGARTVLVDATFRFLDEFLHKEKTSLTRWPVRLAQKGKAREEEIDKKEDNEMDPFIPRYVYDAMKEKRQFKSMLNGQQHDAEEFFWAYLDALDEEVFALFTSISTHKPPSSAVLGEGSQSDEAHWQTELGKRDHFTSSVKAPISCIFDGTFRTTMHMAGMAGQPDAVTIEGRRSLKLDIQPDSVHTVQDALAYFSRPRFAQVGAAGPIIGQASRQVTVIEALPPVLVLHLKRFSYDAAIGSVVKNSKPVQFSSELEIPPDLIAPGAGHWQPAWPARYTLYGVLYHHGKSGVEGHYTVDVLHPNAHADGGDVWLHIDDETVSTLRHEDVFGRHDNERVDDRCTHLLFYRRTASPQTG